MQIIDISKAKHRKLAQKLIYFKNATSKSYAIKRIVAKYKLQKYVIATDKTTKQYDGLYRGYILFQHP